MYCPHCMNHFDNRGYPITVCPSCGGDLSVQNNAFQLPVGTLLANRYYVGKVIGQGGFGITYVGCDTKLNMKIAVKEYYPQGLVGRITSYSNELTVTAGEQQTVYERQKQRFISEAQILAEFAGDAHVVRVSDILSENNTVYIIMEYIDGITLEACRHEKGKLGFREVLGLLEPIMETLGEIHSKGLIHRDISPANIMITNKRKEVKLLDFGAARDYEKDSEKSMSVILKPGYAPSEQYSRHGAQGPWSDVYALCATMYRLITGVVPENSFERMAYDAVKYPSELGAEITAEEESVLMCGMAVQSVQRFTSMNDLLSAFKEAEAGKVAGRAKVFYRGRETAPTRDSAAEKVVQAGTGTTGYRENRETGYEETEILQEETEKTEVNAGSPVRKTEENKEREANRSTGLSESAGKPKERELNEEGALSDKVAVIKKIIIEKRMPLLAALIGILVLIGIGSLVRATKDSAPTAAPAALAEEWEAGSGAGVSADAVEEIKEEMQPESDAEALCEEGLQYYENKVYSKAYECFAQAAEQGNAEAQNHLGGMFFSGYGVEQSYEEAARYYKLAAEQGNDAAQNSLGLMYERGIGVEQNYEEAVKYYRLAADQGNGWAQNNLGYMYQEGLGTEQDYEEAMRYYRLAADQENVIAESRLKELEVKDLYEEGLKYYKDKEYSKAYEYFTQAAEQGNAEAQYRLGHLYRRGLGVEQDYGEAVKYYRLSADQGNAIAQGYLGYMYYTGKGVEQNYEEAQKYYELAVDGYKIAADQGDEEAQNDLGYMYLEGLGVERDYEEAAKYYKLAADQGYDIAQSSLGLMYKNGIGVEQNYEEAVKYYRLAADQGYASAQNSLGGMYKEGLGIEQNYEEAVYYFRLAADQGYAAAQVNLAMMYFGGNGVEQSYDEAKKYFELAADQGNAFGMRSLGLMYATGTGGEQNDEMAEKYFRLAADHGDVDSQRSLGYMYASGHGVEKNSEEAVKYFRLAADQGDADAAAALKELGVE